MFERLVYVSRATAGTGASAVYDIIRTSHNRNSVLGLTGGLLYIDDHFVQVLEGEQLRVRERFERIACDPRHTNVEVRQVIASERPVFPGEWMAVRHGAEIGPELRAAFGYEPGLPAARFDGERIIAFVLAACGLALPA
jgi:Sensors of blue-light using FAD